MIRPRPQQETLVPHGARLRCLCLLAAFAGFAMCPLPSGLYLTAQTPSKEYIRLGNRVIAIESPVVSGVSATTQHICGGGGTRRHQFRPIQPPSAKCGSGSGYKQSASPLTAS